LEYNKYIVYTDGSCVPNPGPGGWCALLISGEASDGEAGAEKWLSGHMARATNNEMEMFAILQALDVAECRSHLLIYTDSLNAINWITRTWKCRSNPEVVMTRDAIDEMMVAKSLTVNFRWVKGHKGGYNHLVDREAYLEALKAREQGG
jgi:ribonuclease HI